MSALNNEQIVERALKLAGNETITDEAQIWLRNILDRLYEDFAWPFLEKLATGTLAPGQSSVPLPIDLDSPWDQDSFVLIDSTGSYFPLHFVTGYVQDHQANPNLLGTPCSAHIDLNSRTWRPYPLPNQSFTWQIRYKVKPDREGLEEVFTPAFPNDDILVQAVFVRALQHEDDDRYVPENQMLAQMIARYKAKFNKQPQKSQKVRFSSRFSTPINFR